MKSSYFILVNALILTSLTATAEDSASGRQVSMRTSNNRIGIRQVASAYNVFDNNCHSYANRSDIYIDECKNNVWGVFSCYGDRALEDPIRYHTITWVYLKNEGRMCLINPQNPGNRTCWDASENEKRSEMPDVWSSAEGRDRAFFMCDLEINKNGERIQQYVPPGGPDGNRFCSKPLPPGVQVAQPGAASCIKTALKLQMNQAKCTVQVAPAGSEKAKEEFDSCSRCCHAQAETWKAKPPEDPSRTALEVAAEYLHKCRSLCRTIFEPEANPTPDPDFAARLTLFSLGIPFMDLSPSSSGDSRSFEIIDKDVIPSSTKSQSTKPTTGSKTLSR